MTMQLQIISPNADGELNPCGLCSWHLHLSFLIVRICDWPSAPCAVGSLPKTSLTHFHTHRTFDPSHFPFPTMARRVAVVQLQKPVCPNGKQGFRPQGSASMQPVSLWQLILAGGSGVFNQRSGPMFSLASFPVLSPSGVLGWGSIQTPIRTSRIVGNAMGMALQKKRSILYQNRQLPAKRGFIPAGFR